MNLVYDAGGFVPNTETLYIEDPLEYRAYWYIILWEEGGKSFNGFLLNDGSNAGSSICYVANLTSSSSKIIFFYKSVTIYDGGFYTMTTKLKRFDDPLTVEESTTYMALYKIYGLC